MSKKSRRRNKRILGALAALGGAAMLANRRRNQANVEMDLPKSSLGSFADARAKMTTNDAYRSNNMPQGIDKAIVDVPVNLGRMTGSGPNSGSIGQNIRANYAQRMRNAVTDVDGSPSILNPVNNRVMVGRGNFKTGGTVVKTGEKNKKTNKKVGIQIRGFGKARRG